jgi:hypothetical protein
MSESSPALTRLNELNRLAASKLSNNGKSGRRRATIAKYGSSSDTAQQCGRCHKTVYAAERVSVGFDVVWHKSCLRCSVPQCNRQLRASDFRKVGELVYCGPHALTAEKEMTNQRLGRHQSEPSILVGGILGGRERLPSGSMHGSQPDKEVDPITSHYMPDGGTFGGTRTTSEAGLDEHPMSLADEGSRHIRRRGSSVTEYSTRQAAEQSPVTSPAPEAKSPVGYASRPTSAGNRKRPSRIDQLSEPNDSKAVSFASPVAKNGVSNSPYFGRNEQAQKHQRRHDFSESALVEADSTSASKAMVVVSDERDDSLDSALDFERNANASLVQDLKEYEVVLQDISEERDTMEEQAKVLQRMLETNTKDNEDTMEQLEEATYELEKVRV